MPLLAGNLTPRLSAAVLSGWAIVVVGLLVYGARVGLVARAGFEPSALLDDWLFEILIAASGIGILARVVLVRTERLAWTMIGLGALAWGAGDIYWLVAFADAEEVPYPSIADGLYLSFYPFVYVGLVLLVRARVRRFHASQWLDGLAAVLVVAAVGMAILLPPILVGNEGGTAAAVAANLAYPLCDLVILALVRRSPASWAGAPAAPSGCSSRRA